jgi:hypothetical protein
MPDPQASPLEKTPDRPVMHKRVEQKDDGRTLIYYTFDQPADNAEKESERTKSGADKK